MTKHMVERIFAMAALAGLAALLPGLVALPRESAGFPLAIVGVMAAMAAILVVRSWRGAGEQTPFFDHPRRFIVALVAVMAYTAVLPKLGFFTSTVLLGLLFPPLFGYRDWRVILPTILIFLSLIWVVFVRFFQRPLPTEFFLG
jgi:hypothetical protein